LAKLKLLIPKESFIEIGLQKYNIFHNPTLLLSLWIIAIFSSPLRRIAVMIAE
jgi:hypothetical protein